MTEFTKLKNANRALSVFAYLDEMRGIVYAKRTSSPSYAGTYMIVYFEDFKTLAVRKNGKWNLANRVFPLGYPGGCYGMAKALNL